MTVERTPAYTVNRDAEGLTERDRQVRDMLAEGLMQKQIVLRLGINKQRVSEIKKRLLERGHLSKEEPPEPLSNSEWRAVSAGLRKVISEEGPKTTKGAAAGRALEKVRAGLLPKGVNW